jgi:DNA polymerase-3 subunit epsilon
MDFVVIDVETANEDRSSICQVGIATFSNGKLTDTWESLVNPEDDFSPDNIFIHGIDEVRVKDAPNWEEVFPQVASRLLDKIVVSHTTFDCEAIRKACDRYSMANFECRWLDSAKVVKRAWPKFSRSGYGLSNVAAHFGISYQAHAALEDARCAGLILLRAIAETGLSPEQWLLRVKQPIHPVPHAYSQSSKEGNPEGRLFGEVLVITGVLTISRDEAAKLAVAAGCRVEEGVTKRTTMLVVGDQDIGKLGGHKKSSKHRKAEKLINEGQGIQILVERDFLRMIFRSME